jgi:hypothetical protein
MGPWVLALIYSSSALELRIKTKSLIWLDCISTQPDATPLQVSQLVPTKGTQTAVPLPPGLLDTFPHKTPLLLD